MEVFIIFSRRKRFNPLGWAIMKAQNLPYSHVCLLVKTEHAGLIYESVWPNARVIDTVSWLKINNPWEYIKLPTPLEPAKVDKCLSSIIENSRGYSFAQLFLNAIGLINSQLNKWAGTVILNHERYLICTELVGRFLEETYNYNFGEHTDSLDLHDIHKAADKIAGVE
jgi:hypothetical protein